MSASSPAKRRTTCRARQTIVQGSRPREPGDWAGLKRPAGEPHAFNFPVMPFFARIDRDVPTHDYSSAAVLTATAPVRAQHMNEKDSPCSTAGTTLEFTEFVSQGARCGGLGIGCSLQRDSYKLDSEDATRLNLAQRLWIRYRDANCTAERELYAGARAVPVVYLACLEAISDRHRSKKLPRTGSG